jgi:radical SAM protein with 4Fe4S-binding SPASM domain
MNRRTAVSHAAIIKNLWRFSRHPRVGIKLAALQAEKNLFNLLYPRAAVHGTAKKIRQLSLRITDVCNLRCIPCGQWGPDGYLRGRRVEQLHRQEVTPERYIELFDDLSAHNQHPLVYLWGGEPMMYSGWREVANRAISRGMPVSIATNGYHCAEAAEYFVEAPFYLFQASIDGHCAELHNAIRPSVSGHDNFTEIMSALAALKEEKKRQEKILPLVASLTTLSRYNQDHIVDIYEAIRDKVDMCIFYLSWWIDEKHAAAHEMDFHQRFGSVPEYHRGWMGNWLPDDFDMVSRQISVLLKHASSWPAPPVILLPHITGEEQLRQYYTNHACRFGYNQCVSIYQAVEVNSNGDMSPCRDYHDYIVGNVKSHTITELWNSQSYRAFRQSIGQNGLMPVCSRCCGLMGY